VTFPAFVHNWRGQPSDNAEDLPDPVVPDAVTVCYVAPDDTGEITLISSGTLVRRGEVAGSPDGRYVLITISNTSQGSSRFGFFLSKDFGATFTYTAWEDATVNEEVTDDGETLTDGTDWDYPVNVVWEPFYGRFVTMWSGFSSATFWWMDPTVEPVTWNQFTAGGTTALGFRSWAVAPGGDGSLHIVGRRDGGGDVGRYVKTNGPDWNNADVITTEDVGQNIKDYVFGLDGIKIGSRYLWRVGYRPGAPVAGDDQLLAVGTTTQALSELNATAGYFTQFNYGHPSGERTFLCKNDTSRTLWPITATSNFVNDNDAFILPAGPEPIRLTHTAWNENAGWIAVGFQETEDASNEGLKRLYVYTSATGIEGEWNGPFALTIPFVEYPADASTSYIEDLDPSRRGLVYLGNGSHWGLVSRRQGSISPIMHCFSATAGGVQIIEDGSVTFSDNNLEWLRFAPDLFWPLNDNGNPLQVLDYGSANYTNTTGTSDITFSAAAPYEGTGALFNDAEAEIKVTNGRLGGDFVVLFVDVTDRVGDITVLEFDYQLALNTNLKVVCGSSGWHVELTGLYDGVTSPATTRSTDPVAYNGDVAEIVFRLDNRKIDVFERATVTPADTIDTPVVSGRFGFTHPINPKDDPATIYMRGEDLTFDNFVIFDTANATVEQVLDLVQQADAMPPGVTLPTPPAIPAVDGVAECIVNAEDATTNTAAVGIGGQTVYDIGNDVAAAPTFDVVGPSLANVSAADPKFGSSHLVVPASPAAALSAYSSPYWRGMASLDVALRDCTLEGWWKDKGTARFGYFGSSQNYQLDVGKLWRWGGMMVQIGYSLDGSGYLAFFIGLSSGQSSAIKSNNSSTGNALTVFANFPAGTFTADTYHHIAITRESAQWRFFVDGRQPNTVDYINNVLGVDDGVRDAYVYASGMPWLFGTNLIPFNNGTQLSNYAQPCHIDGFRFVIDEALYTQNFPVPTSAPSES
jgi:hypothetical protein